MVARESFEAQRMDWLEQVACDPGLPPFAARIAIVIAKNVNRHTGDTWRGVDRMAAEVRTTDRSVQRMIRALADAGHLAIESGTGRKNTNRYRWIIKPRAGKGDDSVTLSEAPTIEKGDTAVTLSDTKDDGPAARKGDRAVAERVTARSQKGDTAVTRTSESTSECTSDAGGPPPGPGREPHPSELELYDQTFTSDVAFYDSHELIVEPFDEDGGGAPPPPLGNHDDYWPISDPIWISSGHAAEDSSG